VLTIKNLIPDYLLITTEEYETHVNKPLIFLIAKHLQTKHSIHRIELNLIF
jgi:hypothetical protein